MSRSAPSRWPHVPVRRIMGAVMPLHTKDINELRSLVLAWYDANRRDLPWRSTCDPYAIWASEVMLQQTQVSRVADYWPRFLRRFPTVRALAEAPQDDVLAEWSGLGYYRRARMLHRAARMVVDELGGALPPRADELRRLPGMGDYTSAAVASIGFGEAVPAIDANAARVFSRLLGLRAGVPRARHRRALASEAARLIDRARPGDFNQAIMELGALICSPDSPGCARCPVVRFCVAHGRGDPESFPGAGAPTRSVELREAVAVVTKGAHVVLARQRHQRGWWEGLWTLPRCSLGQGDDPVAALAAVVLERLALVCRFVEDPIEKKYAVTRHRVTAVAIRGTWIEGDIDESSGAKWIPSGELPRVGVPAPDRAILDALLAGDLARDAGASGELRPDD